MKPQKIVYAFLFIVLFIIYSFLAFKASGKFTSPDETANFYFTKQFAKNLSFKVPEPLEKIAPIVAPRSAMIQKDGLAPGSFLGMPLLYGIISWFLGNWIILFLTPFASVLAVYFFYRLIEIIFDRRIALISAALMAIHPAFWYYTARGMFHNALFLDFLIIGLWGIATAFVFHPLRGTTQNNTRNNAEQKLLIYYGIAGIMIGTVIAVRTSEIIWITVLLLAIVIVFRKLIDWRVGIWVALLGIIIPMLPIFYQNQKLYGNALIFSYTVAADSSAKAFASAEAATGSGNWLIQSIAHIFNNLAQLFEKAIFPFGIHWDNIFANVWNYGMWVAWPFSLLIMFGMIYFFKKSFFKVFAESKFENSESDFKNYLEIKNWKLKIFKKTQSLMSGKFVYFILYLFTACYLILYYGSWKLTDNILGGDAVSLEQSYARYWLPIYIFGLPFASLIVLSFQQKISAWLPASPAGRRVIFRVAPRSGLIWLVIFLLFNFSITAVVLERNVGLAKIRENAVKYKEAAVQTKRLVEPNAVIVSGKADKMFFPEFKVIAGEIDADKKEKLLKKILKQAPVYVSILDFAGQAEKLDALEKYGFKIGKEIKVGEEVSLYKLSY